MTGGAPARDNGGRGRLHGSRARWHRPVTLVVVGRARVDVLGPLRLVVEGAVVEVRGFKRRAALARLALAEGRTVTVNQLVDTLWPEEAPESGRQALHSLVSRLRSQLGPAGDQLVTTPAGYRLDLGADGLDMALARALLRGAQTELEHDPSAAYAHLLEADGLWRGPALVEFADLEPIAAAAVEAEQLHREVTDSLVAAAVGAGQPESVLARAAAAVGEDPLRERAVLLQMKALAATGDSRTALHVARNYRHRLVEETGLDPSSALDAAERAVAGGVAAQPFPPDSRRSARPRHCSAATRRSRRCTGCSPRTDW